MKKILSLLCLNLIVISAFAQDVKKVQDVSYRRSSLYSVLLSHSGRKFEKDIEEEFQNIPISDKYNDHNLNVKVIKIKDRKLSQGEAKKLINRFIDDNNIASHLIARWFNRNIITGECNFKLLEHRANYNASLADVEAAEKMSRGISGIMDASADELINSTFFIVNDIRYIDRSKGSSLIGSILSTTGNVLSQVEASLGNNLAAETYQFLGNTTAGIVSSYKGFKCKVNTYLYRLVWDDKASGTFYKEIYCETAAPAEKKNNFEKYKPSFKLEYVGMQESSGANTSFLGINEKEPQLMVRKACQRAIDENVANLQKNFDVFKVKTPLYSIDKKLYKAEIGLKEGVNASTKFEVLEQVMNKDGSITYKRVGVVKPDPSKIWDNRFMATEEGAKNASLAYTTFIKVSGSDFYDGMLIRQIK